MDTRRPDIRGTRVQLTVLIDLDQREALVAIAKQRRLSLASVVRQAVDDLIGKEVASEAEQFIRTS